MNSRYVLTIAVFLCLPFLLGQGECSSPGGLHTLTVFVSGNGSVTLNPTGGTYAAGTSVTLTAFPGEDWEFEFWEGQASGSSNPTKVVVNSNTSVTAVFVALSGGNGPNLTVDTNSVDLDEGLPSDTVTVSNVDDGTLSWTASSNDVAVTVSPSSFTGNSKVVTISSDDFSESYEADVTFTNDADGGDTATVTVSVTGTGGGGDLTPGEMVSIAGGTFSMGDSFDEGSSAELPVHSVTLSGYEIGKYEVTNQEFADVLNWANDKGYLTTASTTTATAYGQELLEVDSSYCQISYSGGQFLVDTRDAQSMADHPVVEVSWYGAVVYANWLSEDQGLQASYNTSTWAYDSTRNGYHLPTEAQWERAAGWTGTSHKRYGNGSDSISSSDVNYSSNNPLGLSSIPYTSPAGYFSGSTSPAGAFDMSGNVWEWCSDWYDSGYYSWSQGTEPEGPSSGSNRVVRGGGWGNAASICRSAYRSWNPPTDTNYFIGFRLAR